jgi:hypothetical protein
VKLYIRIFSSILMVTSDICRPISYWLLISEDRCGLCIEYFIHLQTTSVWHSSLTSTRDDERLRTTTNVWFSCS